MLSCVRGHCVSTELRVVHGFALAVVVIVVQQDKVLFEKMSIWELKRYSFLEMC
jgi:hypothetical protein